MKTFILFAAVLFVSVTLQAQKENQTGKKAPNFKLESVDGNMVELKKELGQGPVILSFWATWCKPCVEEMAEFAKIINDYKNKNVKLIAVSIDNEKSVAKVKPFIKTKNFPFLVLLDTNSDAAMKYYVHQQVPHTFLIDKGGRIVYSHSGYKNGDELEVKKEIDKLLSN